MSGDAAAGDIEARGLDVAGLPGGLRAALEAVLMVVEQPLPADRLAAGLQVPLDTVAAMLRGLAAEYDEQQRGFELRELGGGWRFYSRAACVGAVERFILAGQSARLSRAALETLAVVAYRQPVSRARVSAVRGVAVDAVMRTLQVRGLVEEAGVDGETGATLYRTTASFLERIGLNSVDELPALAPYLPEADALDEIDELAQARHR